MMASFLDARIWIEWVDSESNWADGISRSFAADSFVGGRGFAVHEILPEVHWWHDAL